MADIEIEIDGRKLTAQPNQMLIQVADAAGIYIPRFCYHKHLSVAANCRMCLVEVEKAPKALPACATPVMQGMKVFTKSEKTIAAQRAVMEFLLINHPLDCPICDQGGECELQDLSMGYGSGQSEYNECKRSVADQDIGPLISTDMTRCILCTRCVRFGEEIAGMREMGVTFRGEHAEIGTYVQHAIKSEVSGNIIDICPVGALTSKPYRFTARAWELDQAPSISPHDCLGTNINVHTRYGKVMRVVTRENNAINETWIADRDRYSYTGLYHRDRLDQPMVRVEGKWRTASWQHAIEVAASGINAVVASLGAEQVGALATPHATLEEFYLLQKIMRALGSPHVDHRLRETDTRDQDAMSVYPGFGLQLAELEQCDAVLLVGSNLQKEQPIAALRLRKAIRKGAAVLAVNPVDYTFNFKLTGKQICAPQRMVAVLDSIVKALKHEAADADSLAFAELLRTKTRVAVIIGALAMNHPQAAELRYLAGQIAELTKGSLTLMTEGANAAGAWIAGAVAHRDTAGNKTNGLSAHAMLAEPRQAYVLLNVEPDMDCANAQTAAAALRQAKFVVALSMYKNPVLEAYANVILPIAAFTETAGTFVNGAGQWQSFTGISKPHGEARPAWKVLRVLGNFLHVDGCDYESAEQIKEEVRSLAVRVQAAVHFPLVKTTSVKVELSRIGEIPIYAGDALVRRAEPLQAAQTIMEGEVDAARVHPETAKKYQLTDGGRVIVRQGDAGVELPLAVDARIARDAVWVAGGRAVTSVLGGLFDKIDIQKA
jgi:NADH-quinone oxidoreductase subunit G